jgi:DNA-binding response OmpR family regulator
MQTEPSVFLLVEDNADDAFFMERAFRRAGLSNPLRIVTNGDEAIEYIDRASRQEDRERYPFPGLIFLDLKLPGRDGFDVLRWLRHEKRSTVPVAVLTSSPEEVDRRRARELGAEEYLIKPPTKDVILECCRRFELRCE